MPIAAWSVNDGVGCSGTPIAALTWSQCRSRMPGLRNACLQKEFREGFKPAGVPEVQEAPHDIEP